MPNATRTLMAVLTAALLTACEPIQSPSAQPDDRAEPKLTEIIERKGLTLVHGQGLECPTAERWRRLLAGGEIPACTKFRLPYAFDVTDRQLVRLRLEAGEEILFLGYTDDHRPTANLALLRDHKLGDGVTCAAWTIVWPRFGIQGWPDVNRKVMTASGIKPREWVSGQRYVTIPADLGRSCRKGD